MYANKYLSSHLSYRMNPPVSSWTPVTTLSASSPSGCGELCVYMGRTNVHVCVKGAGPFASSTVCVYQLTAACSQAPPSPGLSPPALPHQWHSSAPGLQGRNPGSLLPRGPPPQSSPSLPDTHGSVTNQPFAPHRAPVMPNSHVCPGRETGPGDRGLAGVPA